MSKEKKAVGRPNTLVEKREQAKLYLHGEWQTFGDIIPSIAGLACYLGVARETIYDWRDKDTEFSDIVKGILAMQERQLLNGGLSGDYNATISKLVLSKHGYTDKAEVDNKSSDGSMTPATSINIDSKAIKDIANKLNEEC